ncbi:hypothetical protein Tco_0489998 [Tanacetum coccineum]
MNQEEIRQVTARDEKWVSTKERNSTCYKEFTISAEVPEIFMQQFWYTVRKKILDICLRIQGVEFAKVLDDESTLTFLIDIGYKGPLYKYPSMFVDHMHQPWRNLAAIINKYLFGKSTSNDRLRKSRIDILWRMFHMENVDYPELIWEDFSFQIDNRQLKKGRRKIMPYRRISEDFQEYRLLILENIPTEGIKQSESYQMFIKYSTSLIPPKKSRDDNIIPEPYVALKLGKSISLTEAAEEEATRQVHATHARIVTESVSEQQEEDHQGVLTLTPEEKLVIDRMQVLKESKKISRRQPTTKGLSEGTGVSLGVPDESTFIPATSSKGTSAKPGVPDEENVTSEPNVILDWGSEHESEYTEEDDYDEKIEWIDDEETNDEFVHGEEHVQDDDEETDDEFVHGDEQVNDDNDEEMTNAKDADTRTSSSILTTPSVAPATTLLPPSFVSTIPLVLLQTTTPIPTPPITTESLSVTTILDPLHADIQRVYFLEKDVQDLKKANNTTTLCVLVRSKMPPAVNAYLGSSLGDALQKVLQKHTKELIQKYPHTIKKELEKTPLPVAQSSSQSQSSLKVAESLSEYELKRILFKKIDKSCSYLTHDKHQALLDALLNSMSLDDAISSGQPDLEKVLRKRDHDDKDPSAGPNQDKKTKRSRTKEPEPSKKSSTYKESSKGKSLAKTSKSGKSMTVEEPVEMASDDIEQTIDDVVTDADQIHADSTQTKDKAPKKDWFKQPPRPPTPNQE